MRELRAAAEKSRDVRLRDFADTLASQDRLFPITRTIEEAWRDAYDAISEAVDAAVRAGIRKGYLVMGLDPALALVNPSAVRYARDRSAQLVAEIMFEQRQVLQRLVQRGIREGYTVHQTARLMRSVVGLNARLANAVTNYRDGLVTSGRSAADTERLATRYADRLLRYRTEMIARTETVIAENVGQEQIWREAVRQGYLARDVERVWLTTADERTCPICRPMDGQRAKLAEPFYTPDGVPVYTPGMTHPHCRCTEVIEVVMRTQWGAA